MIKGITKNGFEFTIQEGADDDWEMLKLIRKTNDDASYAVDVAERLLGEEQLARLEDHCRKGGIVRLTMMEQTIEEIFDEAKELKNSEPSPA